MFLIVFMWNLYKCKCWLVTEVILQNARCNNKIYDYTFINMAYSTLATTYEHVNTTSS